MYIIFGLVVLLLAAFVYLRSKSDPKGSFRAVLAEKQILDDGCAILVFLTPSKKNGLGLKPGEHLDIR